MGLGTKSPRLRPLQGKAFDEIKAHGARNHQPPFESRGSLNMRSGGLQPAVSGARCRITISPEPQIWEPQIQERLFAHFAPPEKMNICCKPRSNHVQPQCPTHAIDRSFPIGLQFYVFALASLDLGPLSGPNFFARIFRERPASRSGTATAARRRDRNRRRDLGIADCAQARGRPRAAPAGAWSA